MTVFDVLSLHKGLSRQLDRAGIKAVDFRFVDLYDDYRARVGGVQEDVHRSGPL